MGLYYFYGNRRVREWFFVDPFEIAIKRHGVGRGLGARGLSLLILRKPDSMIGPDHGFVGRWLDGDVFVSADDYDPEFSEVEKNWTNIGPDVIDMLSVVDPESFVAAGETWFPAIARSSFLTDAVRSRLVELYESSAELASYAAMLRNGSPSEQ